MPDAPATPSTSRGRKPAAEAARVPTEPAAGAERTRDRPVYAPRVDIVETEEVRAD